MGHPVAQRRRRHLKVMDRGKEALQPGPQPALVGVGGEHDPGRGDLSARHLHPPERAVPTQRLRGRAGEHLRPRTPRSAGQPAHIAQGLDRARARIAQPGGKGGAAGGAAHLPGVQQIDRHAHGVPRARPRLQIAHPGGVMGGVQRARAGHLAADLVALDQVEHLLRGLPHHRDIARAIDRPQRRRHLVGGQPGTGIHQPDIAPRAAMARRLGLQHHAGQAQPGAVQRRREAGIAAADDAQIGLQTAGQRAGQRRLGRRGLPQAACHAHTPRVSGASSITWFSGRFRGRGWPPAIRSVTE